MAGDVSSICSRHPHRNREDAISKRIEMYACRGGSQLTDMCSDNNRLWRPFTSGHSCGEDDTCAERS